MLIEVVWWREGGMHQTTPGYYKHGTWICFKPYKSGMALDDEMMRRQARCCCRDSRIAARCTTRCWPGLLRFYTQSYSAHLLAQLNLQLCKIHGLQPPAIVKTFHGIPLQFMPQRGLLSITRIRNAYNLSLYFIWYKGSNFCRIPAGHTCVCFILYLDISFTPTGPQITDRALTL